MKKIVHWILSGSMQCEYLSLMYSPSLLGGFSAFHAIYLFAVARLVGVACLSY